MCLSSLMLVLRACPVIMWLALVHHRKKVVGSNPSSAGAFQFGISCWVWVGMVVCLCMLALWYTGDQSRVYRAFSSMSAGIGSIPPWPSQDKHYRLAEWMDGHSSPYVSSKVSRCILWHDFDIAWEVERMIHHHCPFLLGIWLKL